MEWEDDSNSSSILIFFHPSNGNINRNSMEVGSTIFSARVTSITIYILNNIIGIPIALIGIIANILSILVFTTQGVKETINISLISLSVSDLTFLVHTLWQSLSLISFLRGITWPFNFTEIAMVLGSIPKNYYRRVSSILTLLMALERCISVIKPLQVKFIFTKKRLVISILSIYFVNALPFIRSMYTYRIGWKFDSSRNRTYLGVIVYRGNPLLDNVGIGLGVFLLFFTFLTVSICAVILVWTLYKQGQWRGRISQLTEPHKAEDLKEKNESKITKKGKETKKSSSGFRTVGSDENKNSSMSERDKRAAKTVTFLAVMYILCYLPGVLFQIAILIVHEFSRQGRYRNAYQVFGLLGGRAESICAGANIVVYFRTSTKFRETMINMFCPSRRSKSSPTSRSGKKS